jgi:4-azaleucine resistance transporter AzlC
MSATTSPAPFWTHFLLGVRSFAPLAVSIAAYGLVWGVLAGQAGMSVFEVALMSGLVFAGASQFVALDMWTAPGELPILSIVIATTIVNLRMLLMTATLRPLLSPLPTARALPATFFVTDENWALTMAELARGRGSVAFLLGTGVLCWLTWTASTLVGRIVGALIDDPTKYGLDFAFTATFLALLMGMWRGRTDIVPWIVAALAAIATARLVDGNWYIIVGGLTGSFTGAMIETLKERQRVG